MGAGISAKALKKRLYNRLKSIEYDLERAGVRARYWDGRVYSAIKPNLFVIGYEVLHASNGEAAASPFITIKPLFECPEKKYGGFNNVGFSFDRGIELVKELFGGINS